mgnify:CR=1 FL=1
MNDVEVLVTVARSQEIKPEAVAEALRGAGMTVSRISELTRIITGKIDEDQLNTLDGIPGVEGVEVSLPVKALRKL